LLLNELLNGFLKTCLKSSFLMGLSGLSMANAFAQTPAPAGPPATTPINFTLYERARVVTTEWFAATPHAEEYGYLESLFRLGLQQRRAHYDWQAEFAVPAVLGLPNDAVSPVTAQGQLGLGGSYYAANGNVQDAADLSFRQGYFRYHFANDGDTLRIGRFEFFEGQETKPANETLEWLQTNRIQQRLVGNFGFTTGQRSFDGVDGHLRGTSWDVTAMAGRPTQGVFNMNANPELNVDIQYLAYTRYLAHQRVQVRGFALGYHDGRTYITKTDNRALAVREADHHNIRVGSYGANATAAVPVASGTVDLLFWGVLQNGQWGLLDHHAGAVAGEAGYRADHIATRPWVRGGFLRSTGDNSATDGVHNTFFQVLPTPRVYARFPFFNMMNSSDQFVQLIDNPGKKLEIRSDLHFLQLTSANDLWYQGGGAYDNKVFGYTGRPANGHSSFSSLYDVSADYALNEHFALDAYYGDAFGKSVIGSIYNRSRNGQFGYFELVYRFNHPLGGAARP
jgi:hypothetical protein